MTLNFHKSYRFKIILSFLFIIALTVLVFIGYNYFNSKSQDLQKITNHIYTVESNFSNNNKNLQSFLLHGYKNSNFYKTGKEQHIDTYIQNISSQQIGLNHAILELKQNNIPLSDSFINNITQDFKSLDLLSKNLKTKRLKLGHRDFGLIGSMRKIIHNIESSKKIPNEQVLQLRRHEKDFLLRSDKIYIEKFNNLVSQIRSKNNLDNITNTSLNKYKTLFNNVANLQYEIGDNNNNGLYDTLFSLNKSASNKINSLQTIALKAIATKNSDINKYVKISFAFILVFITSLIIYLSQILTRDLKRLQLSMYKFIKSDFKEYDINKNEDKSKILEIDFLYKAYELLKENLLENIDGLKLTIEELERTTAYKSSFLANMSHEIRTPLNGIIGVLNMLNQTNLNNNQVKLLEIANYSSNHLLGLINLILDYSKISAGKMELEDRSINIDEDLNKLIKIFQFQASEKGIDLFYNYEKKEDTSNFVLGDTIRINQIIINLLNNAIKFTKKGWVKLYIKQEKLDKDYDSFYVSLEDTGIGIDEKKAQKIFQAFEQVDLSTTRKFGGTGLGLTISYELAALMGSELKFKPAENGGTLFYFNLKLKRSSKDVKVIESNSFSHDFKKIGKIENVLIVDDNVMNQKVLGLMLKKFDLKISYASNGIEAIEFYKQNPYDLIFMDIQMPIMNGLTATKTIKKSNKFKSNPIPIIAVSANAYIDDKKQANEAGIDDFISKPIELKNLYNLLIKYSFKETYNLAAQA